MTITTKMHEYPAARRAIAVVVLVATALLFANGARLMIRGATGNSNASGSESGVMAVAESGLRPTEPVAVTEPVGAGRSIPGPDGWLTYTDPTQRWQLDVPAPMHEVDAGEDTTALAALQGDSTYSVEWTPALGTLDLFEVTYNIIEIVQSDMGFNVRGEILELGATVEPSVVGELDAVRFSVDIGVGEDLIRHSGVVFQLGGDLVSAAVLDFGGSAPIDADRYLSSLRTLS